MSTIEFGIAASSLGDVLRHVCVNTDYISAFTTFYLFGSVIASLARDLRRFNALAIQTGGAGFRVTSFSQAQLGSQSIIDGFPKPTTSPCMVIERNCAICR